jgi:hypothetical protein
VAQDRAGYDPPPERAPAGQNPISGTGYTFLRGLEDPKLRADARTARFHPAWARVGDPLAIRCIAVYSTDLPHFESNPDPIGHSASHLADPVAPLREDHLGENILACYARMGRPLELA